MTKDLKPVLYGCIVCRKLVTGLSCDDPEHQEMAAEAMDTNAGIPTMTRNEPSSDADDCEVYPWLMRQPDIAANHLLESPLGMDVDLCQHHK